MSADSDPCNFLTNPPSTVVKVVNTARDDMNGQLGIVVSFQADRGRYLVHVVSSQSTLALKPDNLVKASTIESYQAQWLQLRNDPRVRRELQTFYDKAKQRLHPVPPEYAAGGILLTWLVLIFLWGFTKTIMLTSVLLMVGVLVGPDLQQGASPRMVLANFPQRCRQAIEQTLPMVQGRISDRMAASIVVAMLLLCGHALFLASPSKSISAKAAASSSSATTSAVHAAYDKYYQMGFDDATRGLVYGTSLEGVTDSILEDIPMPAATKSNFPKFGFGSAMSAFYLYRIVKDLGTDVGGGFQYQRVLQNARTLEPWKMGMVAFSLYNILKSFV